jgi:hypothetical protein
MLQTTDGQPGRRVCTADVGCGWVGAAEQSNGLLHVHPPASQPRRCNRLPARNGAPHCCRQSVGGS